jgi:hypothetical protein
MPCYVFIAALQIANVASHSAFDAASRLRGARRLNSTLTNSTALNSTVVPQDFVVTGTMKICQDTRGWSNGYSKCKDLPSQGGFDPNLCSHAGWTCAAYTDKACHGGSCCQGGYVKGWAGGATFNNPALNCCACGKHNSPPSGYTEYEDKNCYSGNGAQHDIDATPVSGLSLSACSERCTEDSACSCFVYTSLDGQCWKRSQCDINSCAGGAGKYSTYLGEATPPTPSPVVPSVTTSRHAGYNCYAPHNGAGENLLPDPQDQYSVAECGFKCVQTSGCNCVVMNLQPGPHDIQQGQCFLRDDCSLARCQQNTIYTTVLIHRWSKLSGYNCYAPSHGAEENLTPDPVGSYSVTDCQELCQSTNSCQCAVFLPSQGQCFLRARCIPSQCSTNTAYDTYMLQ